MMTTSDHTTTTESTTIVDSESDSSDNPGVEESGKRCFVQRGSISLHRLFQRTPVHRAAVSLTLLALFVAEPVAAQDASEAFCQSGLAQLLSGFFSVMTVVGAVMGLLAYQWTTLVGMVAQDQQTRKNLKQRESQITVSSVKFFSLGSVYIMVAQVTPLPGLGCVSPAIGL